MYKKILVAVTLTVYAFNCHAQTDSVKTKLFNHYVGVQVNELLKQLINLNSEAKSIDNPYLVTYALHHAKSGWGINAGAGYDYKKVVDKNVHSDKETTTNNFSFRAGVGRKVKFGQRLEAGFSLDYVLQNQTTKTFSFLITNFGAFTDSTATTVTHKISGNGLGGQLNIAYRITDRLLIGTEATGYYMQSKDKETTVVSTLHSNNTQLTNTFKTETTETEVDTDTFKFTVPVAIFLIVRF